jgi:hypothetical protein
MASSKECFVIAPIGEEGTDVRLRSDQVFTHIISPPARECGYIPLRADHISKPGVITTQVIRHVIDNDLVIADLTGPNPNVFYELSLRHALKKPVVQIIDITEDIPFDVASNRTVRFNYRDLDSAERARKEIAEQIKAVESDPTAVDNPISFAFVLQSLGQVDNPLAKSNQEIITMLQDIRGMTVELNREHQSMRQFRLEISPLTREMMQMHLLYTG